MNSRLALCGLAWSLILVPAFLIYRFANASFASLLELTLSSGVLLIVNCLLTFIGRWDWFGIWIRYLLLPLSALLVISKCLEFRQLAWLPEVYPATELSVNALLILVAGFCTVRALVGTRFRGNPVDISFPLSRGVYCISHGGSDSIINYHASDATQKFGVDVVKLGVWGTRATGLYPGRLDRYAIWGEHVLSPVQGTVLSVVDGIPDHSPTESAAGHAAGNHIVIRPNAAPNAYILLAHLQRHSVKVRPGEVVREGRLIAAVGNSGSTTEPCLHIHCATIESGQGAPHSGPFPVAGAGVPVLFSGNFLVRNNLVIARFAEKVDVEQLATSTV